MNIGDIQVRHILALIIVAAVIALIFYWSFILQPCCTPWITGLEECMERASTYCGFWRDMGYAVDETLSAPNLGSANGGIMWFSAADSATGVAAYAPGCAAHNILAARTIGSKASGTGLMGECESILNSPV